MAACELQQADEILRLELARLHLDRPLAPASLQDAIDFERLFAPVRDFLARVPRVRQEAFSTHAPKRAGSPLLLAMPCGSMTATGALFSVTSFGGAALRRAARVEYLVSADWTYSNNYSIMT